MVTASKSPELVNFSAADKADVLLQIERLLSSPQFRNSRRYTDLLRYVVQETIEGRADILKERTLGVEVFGRSPGFDTSGDSIVRVAAAEVRKRIAQYYQEEGRERELRIELPNGSYVPHFRRPPERQSIPAMRKEPAAQLPAAPLVLAPELPVRFRVKPWVLAVGGLAVALAAVAGIRIAAQREADGDLLASVWKSPQGAILCIGVPKLTQNQSGANDQTASQLGKPTANNTLVPFADAMTLARLQVRLHDRGKANRVQLARNISFEDLRSGPAILIGALDNPWTMRLTSQMRFRFLGTDELEGEIVDTRGTHGEHWLVDFHAPYSDRSQDYAIVAITHDATLDQPLVIAAGVGPDGTAAAGEFLLNPGNRAMLAKMAPAMWGGKNVEVVLATQVIQGNSGPPRILAAEFW